MRIAIIGAGFCGLAAAWHLMQHQTTLPAINIQIFDPQPIGTGTSGMSAGLLNPYVGRQGIDNGQAKAGLEATLQLLEVAAKALNRSVVANSLGILRLAHTEEDIRHFHLCAARHAHSTTWLDPEECQTLVPLVQNRPGLWIKNGLSIFPQLYVKGLWQACQNGGVYLNRCRITSLTELKEFDVVVVAAGAETTFIVELADLPLNKVKGQVLKLSWPTHLPPLKCALSSQSYLVMDQNPSNCIVGATYEREYSNELIDLDAAKELILPRAHSLFPPLRDSIVLGGSAGVRSVAPQHQPLIKQVSGNCWVFAGMGSKGLLYHALYAKELAKTIVSKIDIFQNSG